MTLMILDSQAFATGLGVDEDDDDDKKKKKGKRGKPPAKKQAMTKR